MIILFKIVFPSFEIASIFCKRLLLIYLLQQLSIVSQNDYRLIWAIQPTELTTNVFNTNANLNNAPPSNFTPSTTQLASIEISQPISKGNLVANQNSNAVKANLQPASDDGASQSPPLVPIQAPAILQPSAKQQIVELDAGVGQVSQQQQAGFAINGQNDNEPLVQLDYSSMNDEILHRKHASFVYFNANFDRCRNCHKFFTIWKELAADIRWWRQVIKLFSINCSDEDNIELCRRAGVTQFPQVKFYWLMSSSLEQDGQRIRILGKSVHAMRHLIMDKVLDNYLEHMKLLSQRSSAQQRSQSSTSGSSSINQQANPLAALLGPFSQLLGPTGPSPGGVGALIQGLLSNRSALQQQSPANQQQQASFSSGGDSGVGLQQQQQQATGLSSLTSLISSLGVTSSQPGVGGGGNINQLMGLVMGANSMRQRLDVQSLPSNWPKLESIVVGNTQQLLNSLPLDESRYFGCLLIMETQEFLYTGLEVMLDLNPYANQTFITRVRDERSQLSKNLTLRDDIQAPALIYIPSATREVKLILTAPKYTDDEDLRRAFVRAFVKKQVKYPLRKSWSIFNNQQQAAANGNSGSRKPMLANSEEDELLLRRIDLVYMNDLTNAIRASLMEQVFRHPELSDDQYNALVKYVYVLINYFPFNNSNDESLKFFKRLHSWLQNQVSPMDISEYKKQFYDIDEVLPKRPWLACKSLSGTKSIPARSRKQGLSLFENPAQIGKVVSNITRLFRTQQRESGKLKTLFNSLFTSQSDNSSLNNLSTTQAPPMPTANDSSIRTDSPIERVLKTLTSGTSGSDLSILKLISSALTGASSSKDLNGGKSKFAREYPCGAWKLAHVLVVNEYIKDSPRKDVKHIVLLSLYQYMLHFYACPTCGNRVSDVISEFRLNLDDHLIEQPDSVLLLWKMHNRINKRLESEFRPGLPRKAQFPTELLCAKCRHLRSQSGVSYSSTNWIEKQVLHFLVHYYRPQSIITNANASSDETTSTSPFQLFGISSASLLTSSTSSTRSSMRSIGISWQIVLAVVVHLKWFKIFCHCLKI